MSRARHITNRAAAGIGIVGLGMIVAGAALWLLISDSPAQGYAMADFSARPASLSRPAPELRLQGLSGDWRRLSDYGGNVVLINLWATWCPPCEAEMPILQRFFERHVSEGFRVVAINDGDPRDDVRAFVAAHQISFDIWLDPGYLATDDAFKTRSLPTSYVMDREGILRLVWLGAISEGNLEKYVTPVIREN
jgi:cytochrome c biogenesis protein CcmG/thiol:disulfide interchange protein DsbE